jgi:hypothetical protein
MECGAVACGERAMRAGEDPLAKVCTAVALNLVPPWDWLTDTPLATTRRLAFAKCCQLEAVSA